MPATHVELTLPSPADVPLIRGYLEQLARDEGVPKANASEAFLRETLFGEAPAACAHLVQSAGRVCGLTVHSWKWGAFSGVLDMYLHVLVLDPAFRGRGIGQAAVEQLLAIAAARGASRLELLTTAGNAQAAAFYDRLGLVQAAHMVVRRKAS